MVEKICGKVSFEPVSDSQPSIITAHCSHSTVASVSGLLLSFLNWAYVRQGVYFWAYGTPGVSIFGVFRTPRLPIFGVIFGLLEATKMYKLYSEYH